MTRFSRFLLVPLLLAGSLPNAVAANRRIDCRSLFAARPTLLALLPNHRRFVLAMLFRAEARDVLALSPYLGSHEALFAYAERGFPAWVPLYGGELALRAGEEGPIGAIFNNTSGFLRRMGIANSVDPMIEFLGSQERLYLEGFSRTRESQKESLHLYSPFNLHRGNSRHQYAESFQAVLAVVGDMAALAETRPGSRLSICQSRRESVRYVLDHDLSFLLSFLRAARDGEVTGTRPPPQIAELNRTKAEPILSALRTCRSASADELGSWRLELERASRLGSEGLKALALQIEFHIVVRGRLMPMPWVVP